MSALLNNYSNRFASNTKLITTRLFAIKYIAERFSWAGQGKLCKDDEIREKKMDLEFVNDEMRKKK